ncbi:MAG: hypothetical protein IJ733_15785, partial [Lachnospiraceae bacterium]|nr:hypothetical protein [Lachnospiraceae bacterium]
KGKTAQEQENGIAKTKGMSEKNSAGKQNLQEDYYQTHSREEINRDREAQIKLIHENRALWLMHTELDDELEKNHGMRERISDGDDYEAETKYDKYAISDLDQNGRLEVLAFDYVKKEIKFFEVNRSQDGIGECKKEGSGFWEAAMLGDNGTSKAFLDLETNIWHYYPDRCDLYKEGDTVYAKEDDEEYQIFEEYSSSQNMKAGYPCISWFQKTYDFYDEDEKHYDTFYTPDELLKAMEISAESFKLKVTEGEGIDYEKIYQEYAVMKALAENDSEKTWYMAIVDSVQPVLLMTTDVYGAWSGGENNAMDAYIYGYNKEKKKVAYIGYLGSTSSAYPLASDGIYIETGFHHADERIYVEDGEGVAELVLGIGYSQGDLMPEAGSYEKIRMTGNEEDDTEKQLSIPLYLAETLHYYRWTDPYEKERPWSSGWAIPFEKVESELISGSETADTSGALKAAGTGDCFSESTVGEYTVYVTSQDAKKVTGDPDFSTGLYEGNYQIEVYRRKKLMDRKKISLPVWEDGSLYFPRKFLLHLSDYNEDGRPDFAIGNYDMGGSYGYLYKFYSVAEDGRISEILDRKGNVALVEAMEREVSPFFESEEKTILYQQYDQEKQENVMRRL